MNTVKTLAVYLGLKGAGKDTLASKEANDSTARVPLAQSLKECAMTVFGYTMEQIEDRDIKEQAIAFDANEINDKVVKWTEQFFATLNYPMPKWMNEPLAFVKALPHVAIVDGKVEMSPRELQRNIGSKEWLRGVDDTLLTLYTLADVRKQFKQTDFVQITDCRMPREINLIANNMTDTHLTFTLVVRYTKDENGVYSSFIQDDGHWTEAMNAELTQIVIDALNNKQDYKMAFAQRMNEIAGHTLNCTVFLSENITQ